MTPTVAIAILAGGASRRMGRDKAALVIDGETLLERAARAAAAEAARVFVIGRERPDGWPLSDIRFVPDPPGRTGIGPLGGIATALEAAEAAGCDAALVTACDMPALSADALRWLMEEYEARRCASPVLHGLVTRGAAAEEQRAEPLFSVYSTSFLPLLRERIDAGWYAVQGAIAAGKFAFADAPAEILAALANINTPEELAAFEAVRRSGKTK